MHNDLDKGIWFDLIAAQHDEVEIKHIAILDFTGGITEDDIQQGIKRIAKEM